MNTKKKISQIANEQMGAPEKPVRRFVTLADEERAKLEQKSQPKVEKLSIPKPATQFGFQKPGGGVVSNPSASSTSFSTPSNDFRRPQTPAAPSTPKRTDYVDIRAFKLEKKRKLLEEEQERENQEQPVPQPVPEKKPTFDVNEYLKSKLQQRNAQAPSSPFPARQAPSTAIVQSVKSEPPKKPAKQASGKPKKKKLDADLVKKRSAKIFDDVD